MKIHENTVTMITPSKFNMKPTRAISETVTFPEENTIAFGGVLTGSINAHEAANVTGIQSCNTE